MSESTPDPKQFTLSRRDAARIHAADLAGYGGMFATGETTRGSGRAFVGGPDGAMAMWNPGDESAAFNTVIGFEHAADPDQAWADALQAARSGGASVFGIGLVEECSAWATPDQLAAYGLEVEYEEVVWARPIDESTVANLRFAAALADGVELVTDGIDTDVLAATFNRGWEVPPEHERGPLYAAALGLPGWTHYLVTVRGEPAGAGALFCHEGVAALMVGATDPAFRGRGLQQALIARRLGDGIAAGCDLAVVETVDDNASPRNVRRAGFHELHRRLMYRMEL